ncbi:PREDICTED: lon protease homolog 1, mitochondrial-like isoform X2 [Camelina sativa]|uniref:Lon protease homolog 1, mitochondrial-like isoform X2 n=1 Tax=Camelina sativa TaxID=90675 RepID=A0ABM0W0W0_CAMSA|nr:PREDICTED: lon protease homolog 1, mitochondrial-like isoform X2 [Camelina sativa]
MEGQPKAVIPLNPSFPSPSTVIALPLSERPLGIGFVSQISVHDSKLLAALAEKTYVGAFLLRDDTNLSSETNINELKGRYLLNQLHKIGLLAYISSIQGHRVILTGLMRIRISYMVCEDPLTVQVNYLEAKPYDLNNDVTRATFFHVSSMLMNVHKTSPIWRNHVQHIGHNFSYSYVADFGALIHCAREHQAQQVDIAFEVIGEGASVEELAVAFEVESRENPNENHSIKSKVHLTNDQEVQTDEYNLASYGVMQYWYWQTPIGVAMALSWTSRGGLTSYMETSFVEQGEAIGCLYVMGQVGEETHSTACTAYKVAHQILLKKQPENNFFANSMLCLHLPRVNDASTVCTMITSLLSLAMKKAVRRDLAMSGKVTLTGNILGIGRVKEKTISARKNRVKTIIFPEANRRDFDELPNNLKEGLDVHFFDEYDQIFELAFNSDH